MQPIERWLGRLLGIGVWTATAVVAVGGAIYLLHHGAGVADYAEFTRPHGRAGYMPGLLRSGVGLSGRGLIQLGLIMLVLLQVVRVGLTVWMFKRQRDLAFVFISLFVLLAMLYSLFGTS